jgi:hypothetical protein
VSEPDVARQRLLAQRSNASRFTSFPSARLIWMLPFSRTATPAES